MQPKDGSCPQSKGWALFAADSDSLLSSVWEFGVVRIYDSIFSRFWGFRVKEDPKLRNRRIFVRSRTVHKVPGFFIAEPHTQGSRARCRTTTVRRAQRTKAACLLTQHEHQQKPWKTRLGEG